jgi:hypothetical protein
MPVYSESDLVVPALIIIAANPNGITTSELSKELRIRLEPSDDDLTLLAGRYDDKFSQKVRNLKSHETLERKGLATFTDGRFLITETGRKFAFEGGEILQSLKSQGFTEAERQSALENDYEDIVIEEGERTRISVETFTLDGGDFAFKAAKVLLSGVYIREANLDFLYADVRAVMMAKSQGLPPTQRPAVDR